MDGVITPVWQARRYRGAVSARPTDDEARAEEPRADTAVSPVIRGESVAIPTPAWGSAILAADEVVIAELIDDDGAPRPASAVADAGVGDSAAGAGDPAAGRRHRSPGVGVVASLLAVATAVLVGVAVRAASGGDDALATSLAYAAIATSAVGVLVGILAIPLRSGRALGAIAAAVSLGANPWILLQVLSFFSP